MVTIKDIAEKSGVSRGTVDRVLNKRGKVAKDKEARVLQVAEELGYKPNILARGLVLRKAHIKIGYLYVAEGFAPLQEKLMEEARTYADELSAYGVEVDFIPLTGRHETAAEDERALWEILKGCDYDGYVAISPVARTIAQQYKAHNRPHVPIVTHTVNEPCEWSICFVGCDYEEIGRLACGLAALMTNAEGKVLFISLDYSDLPSSSRYMHGFETEAEKYPGLSVVNTVGRQAGESAAEFLTRLDRELAHSPQADVAYLLYAGEDRDSARVSELCEKYHLRAIVNDLITPQQQRLLRDGKFSAMILQEVEEQGRKPLEILFQHLAFGTQPESDWHKIGFRVKLPQEI